MLLAVGERQHDVKQRGCQGRGGHHGATRYVVARRMSRRVAFVRRSGLQPGTSRHGQSPCPPNPSIGAAKASPYIGLAAEPLERREVSHGTYVIRSTPMARMISIGIAPTSLKHWPLEPHRCQ